MTVADLVIRFFHAVDRRDWSTLRVSLTDEVDTDYTELFGGQPQRLAATDLIDQWRALLPGFDATQHFLGPLVMTPDRTTDADTASGVVECSVRGYHRLGEQVWMVAGWYSLTVRATAERWQIAGITLHVSYEDGDRGLTEMASERAS